MIYAAFGICVNEEPTFLGVFSDHEKAQAAYDRLWEKHGFDYLDLKAVEIDEVQW